MVTIFDFGSLEFVVLVFWKKMNFSRMAFDFYCLHDCSDVVLELELMKLEDVGRENCVIAEEWLCSSGRNFFLFDGKVSSELSPFLRRQSVRRTASLVKSVRFILRFVMSYKISTKQSGLFSSSGFCKCECLECNHKGKQSRFLIMSVGLNERNLLYKKNA